MTDDRKPESALVVEDLPSGYCRECNAYGMGGDCPMALVYDGDEVACEGFYPKDEEE